MVKGMKRREFLNIGFQHINFSQQESLKTTDSEEGAKSGIAMIDTGSCSAWTGGDCRMCYIKCPLLDKAIVIEDFKPVVIGENCNGCGICENICSMINGKAFIKVFLKGINT